MGSRTDTSLLNRLWVLPGILLIAAIFLPPVVSHVRFTADPYVFNDDTRLDYVFYRQLDPDLFPDDPFSDYALAGYYPEGYKLFRTVMIHLADPHLVNAFVPVLFYALLLALLSAAVRRLQGSRAVWWTIIMTLGTTAFWAKMVGLQPRAFDPPVMALACFAVVWARPLLLAAATVLGALFYPVGAVIAGLMMVIDLLLPRRLFGETGWPRRRYIVLTAAAGLTCLLIWLPGTLAGKAYGNRIGFDQAREWPEAGMAGRNPFDVMASHAGFFGNIRNTSGTVLFPGQKPLIGTSGQRRALRTDGVLIALLLVPLAGWIILCRENMAARRLLAAFMAIPLGYALACLLHPHLYYISRYVQAPLPVFLMIFIPVGLLALIGKLTRRAAPWIRRSAWLAVMLPVTLLTAGTPGHHYGHMEKAGPYKPVYSFLASLPKDATIAAWPGNRLVEIATINETIPYLSKRKVLVMSEAHMPHQDAWMREMRARMRLLIRAYFATDPAPVRELQKAYGVRYMVIEQWNYDQPPVYFEPFNRWAAKRWEEGKGRFLLPTLRETAGIFHHRGVTVLDLEKLPK